MPQVIQFLNNTVAFLFYWALKILLNTYFISFPRID